MIVMTIVQRLLSATEDIWSRYHTHPFVKGIADGSLDKEKFKHYMIQDYIYLIDYAKVFSLGAAKAKDVEAMRLFSAYLSNILDVEMDIHRGYMKRLGISLDDAENTAPALETSFYTSYMLRAAYEDGAAEIAAAILSCALSYEVIAKNIVKSNPKAQDHPFYGEWIKGYANDEYAEANRALENLTERLAYGCSKEQEKHLIEIFTICSRCEELFWDMAWEMRR